MIESSGPRLDADEAKSYTDDLSHWKRTFESESGMGRIGTLVQAARLKVEQLEKDFVSWVSRESF
jgi:hypothetical protein